MSEYTKISFSHRKQISDYGDLVEILFPGNRNQQHAAACILFELKWNNKIVPSLSFIENQYDISCRVLQRTRAKLSRLGFIEHISSFNTRYGGQAGWKLSTRFERSLNQLAQRCTNLRNTKSSSKEKDLMLVEFANTRRNILKPYDQNTHSEKEDRGENMQ
jgi:hypothetical protein